MQDLIAKAATLLEALPYIQRFRGATFVVKYGGSFMDSPDPTVRSGVARDLLFLEARHRNDPRKATEKAKRERVAVLSIVQAGHTGRLAAFTERAARRNVAMFMAIGTVGGPITAPYGGAAAVLGTNPISFSIPNPAGPPVTFDIATSAIAAGKIKVAKAKHEPLPPGAILDRNGRPSTDPQAFFDGGMLLPFGGHKGYGLAMIAELLSGPMAGADAFPGVTRRSGIFMFAVDVTVFRPLADYEKALEQAELAYRSLVPLLNRYWLHNLASMHNAKRLFNMDISGGIGEVVVHPQAPLGVAAIEEAPAEPRRAAEIDLQDRVAAVFQEARHGARRTPLPRPEQTPPVTKMYLLTGFRL
jgi:hypothetical protein